MVRRVPMAGLDDLIEQFRFNTEAILQRLLGLERDRLLRRPDGRGNHVVWLLGHIAGARGIILEWLGAGERFPLLEDDHRLFGMGSKIEDEDEYPPTEELLDRLKTRGEALCEAIAGLSEEDANRKFEIELPLGRRTVRDMLRFMYFHETYHYGQLSYLASWLGSPLGI
jgi:uncharacterized damage-inducible protein DinB